MKRILALILALVMCVGMFASCELLNKITGKNNGESGYDVEAAVSYLYSSKLKDYDGKETKNDFDLPAKVVRDGVEYTVTWTTNSDKVTIKESGKESFVTVDIPDTNDAEFEYKLIATVTDPDGKEAVKEVTVKVPVIKAAEGVVNAPVAGVAYKLYIDQKAVERRIYALDTFKSGKLQATNDPKKATDYFVEAADGGYYIYAMVNGAKKYLSFAKVTNPNGGFYDNVVYTDAATSVWKYDSEFSVWFVAYEAETFGLGAYSTNEAFGVSNISFFKDAEKKDGQYPAKFITKEYAETLTPDVGVTNPEGPAKDTLLTLAEASELGAQFLHNTYSANKYYVEGKITNITSADYGNMIIADDNGGSLTIYGSYINGDKFGTSSVQPKIGDTVKLYGVIGQYNNTPQMKNADIVLINGAEIGQAPSVEMTVEELLTKAFALNAGESITGPFTFDGVVSGHTDDDYKNVIVVLGGQTDKAIVMYRVTDERLTVGTKFNFTAGSVKNYNGTVEFMNVTINSIEGVEDSGSANLAVVNPVAGTAYKLGLVNTSKDNNVYYICGGMASTYYLATSSSVSSALDVYLETTDGGYYLYVMDDGSKLYINFVVTTGDDGKVHVNAKYEAAASTVFTYDETLKTVATLIDDESYILGTRNDKTYTTVGPVKASSNPFYCQFYGESDGSDTPVDPQPPVGGEMSIADAIAAADGTNVIVTGVVISTEAWNTQFNNMSVTIKDEEGNSLYIFRLATQVGLGDTIVVTGVMATYNENRQIAQGATATIQVVHGDNHTYVDGSCSVCGTKQLAANEVTVDCDFSTLAKGTQYADETVSFGDDITVSTQNGGCHFNTQLRIYDSSSNDGWAVVAATGNVTAVTVNCGYNEATLNVYGSVDGETWVLIEEIFTTSAYANYSFDVDGSLGYKYLKLDASGAQIRVAKISVTIAK